MTRLRAAAIAVLCLLPAAAMAQKAPPPLSPRQHELVMQGPEMGQHGYQSLTTPHKALAACIRWAEVKPDRVPVVALRSYGGGNVDVSKRQAMELCRELERSGKCTCRLIDVDGKPAP